MEGHVGSDEDADIADGGRVGVECRLQALDVVVGRDPRRLPGDPGLEQQARLLHVLLALGSRGDPANEACHLPGHEFARRRRYPGAGAAGDFHQALLLQGEQRLAHRGAPDAETLGQFFLGGHGGALLELSGGNGAFDLFGNLVGPLAAAERHRGHRCLHVIAQGSISLPVPMSYPRCRRASRAIRGIETKLSIGI
jgi:hypothetical protein